MSFGSASARPWYGRAARVGTGGGLHAVVAQQVRASVRQAEDRRFDSGQPLARWTSPMAEASRSRRERFAVRVRGPVRKANRTGAPGSVASGCGAVRRWRSTRPPSSAWKMTSPGGGPRLESGWWRKPCGSSPPSSADSAAQSSHPRQQNYPRGEAIRLVTELVSKTGEASPPLRVRPSPSPPLEGAPSARALNTSRGPRGPRGDSTCTFRWRRLSR